MTSDAKRRGKVTTFYSYKGGTGRTMALANVAWIFAARGERVLALDWDLEAPGLHRYFAPFLRDPSLVKTEGLLEWIYEYLVEVTTPSRSDDLQPDWWHPYAEMDAYAVGVNWPFPEQGCLHLLGCGIQNSTYAERVNKFDWFRFYTEHGGRAFLDYALEQARTRYDHILIDSRTGVSDTSGICTIQLPDQLVALFTLNNQSIDGAAEVARSAAATRAAQNRPLRVLPVATRVELAEDDRLKRRQRLARERFGEFVPERERNRYFGQQQIQYVPYYAYEEVLATIKEEPASAHPVLMSFVNLAAEAAGKAIGGLPEISPAKRAEALAAYASVGAEPVHASPPVERDAAGAKPAALDAPRLGPSSLGDGATLEGSFPPSYDVFISYPTGLSSHAEALYRHVSPRCVAFIATRSVPAGANMDETVRKAYESAKLHVVLVGPHPAIEGGWYEQEVKAALTRRLRTGLPIIVPVLVDGARMPSTSWGQQLAGFQGVTSSAGSERNAAAAILQALGVDTSDETSFVRERAVAAEVRLEEAGKRAKTRERWIVVVAGMAGALASAVIALYPAKIESTPVTVAPPRPREDEQVVALVQQANRTATLEAQVKELGAAVNDLDTYANALEKPSVGKAASSLPEILPIVDDARAQVDALTKRSDQLQADLEQGNIASDQQQKLRDEIARNKATLRQTDGKLVELAASLVTPTKTEQSRQTAQRAWRSGYQYYNRKDFANARKYYQEARELDPNYAPAINSLGVLEYGEFNFEGADALFSLAISKDPSYAPAHTNHALALRELGDLRSARLAAEKALAIRPSYAPALRALSLIDEAARAAKGDK